MYERIQGNDMYNGATNPPGDFQPTLNNVSLSNPGLRVTDGSLITAAQLPVLPLGITGVANPYKPGNRLPIQRWCATGPGPPCRLGRVVRR